jgi:hypothetical protein
MSHRIDSVIEAWTESYPTSEKALSLYRIFFASYAILFGLKRFAWVADYPGGLWRPPFPFSLLDAYGTFAPGLYATPMPEYVLLFLEGLLCLLFVLLLFGIGTPYVSVSITGMLIILNWQIYSLPKTNHDVLFCITPLMMVLSGWGQHFSLDARWNRKGKAYPSVSTALLALTITTGFAVAGLPKLVHWVDFDLSTSGVRMWITGIHFSDSGGGPLSGFVTYITTPVFWETLDLAAVLFEVGFLFAVVQRRFFRWWMVAAVGFHFTNYLIMGIPFFFNLPVYAAFLPWNRMAQYFVKMSYRKWIEFILTHRGKAIRAFVFVLIAAEILYFARPAVGLHRTGGVQVFQVFVVFGTAFTAILYFTFFEPADGLPAEKIPQS